MDVSVVLDQIGRMTVLAISGGRTVQTYDALELPVSSGYSVRITLAADDTYTVQRVYRRGDRTWIKGVREGVYCDEISDVAYYASSYKSHEVF